MLARRIAVTDWDETVLKMFRSGLDTYDIAVRLNVSEELIVRALDRARGYE